MNPTGTAAPKSAVVPLSKLIPSEYNPRGITKRGLSALAQSVEEFGYLQRIVVNNRTRENFPNGERLGLVVVGGHQRLKVLKARGDKAIEVVVMEVGARDEKRANLALQDKGTYDDTLLGDVLRGLELNPEELSVTGFGQDEVDALVSTYEREAGGLETQEEDLAPPPPRKARTRFGEVIELGRHRLLCGDANDLDQIKRLLAGAVVSLVNIDPPYNVKVEPRSNNAIASGLKSTKGNVPAAQREKLKNQSLDLARHPSKAKATSRMRAKDRAIDNDFIDEESFRALLATWFANIAAVLKKGGAFYVWAGYMNIKNVPAAIEGAGLYFSQAIIWHKKWPVLTRKDFMGDHEWAFYGWKKGGRHYFTPSIKNATDVWVVPKISPQSMIHLTQKPVELARRAILYSTRPGENVLDLFAGSGSTLIAAEQTKRRCFLMEIDPAYCDVIRDRFAALKPSKAEDGTS
jgi:DNA modification methylase